MWGWREPRNSQKSADFRHFWTEHFAGYPQSYPQMCWLGAFPGGWRAAPLTNPKARAEQNRQSDSGAFTGPRIAD